MDAKVVLAACPFCGCGRCAVRLCTERETSISKERDAETDPREQVDFFSAGEGSATVAGHHAFILCDSCHATWLEPDLATCHQYLGAIDPVCPLCQADLKEEDGCGDALKGSWATADQVKQLGWDHALAGTNRLSMEEIEQMFQGDGPIDFSGGTL